MERAEVEKRPSKDQVVGNSSVSLYLFAGLDELVSASPTTAFTDLFRFLYF